MSAQVICLADKLAPWRLARARRAALLPLQMNAALWQLYWALSAELYSALWCPPAPDDLADADTAEVQP